MLGQITPIHDVLVFLNRSKYVQRCFIHNLKFFFLLHVDHMSMVQSNVE
ncbi:unnamed protein product [Amoebophrya sp. A25]|nr:unnamed protein product [Amoebophrya sp. A25]|eukprot:GSA25T00003705001.1